MLRPAPAPQVRDWLREHDEDLVVSIISLGEIQKGIELLDDGVRKATLARHFKRLEMALSNRVLGLDRHVFSVWAGLVARHQKRGQPLPVMDSLLAATALANDLTVVTRNVRDFPAEVRTLNPWG